MREPSEDDPLAERLREAGVHRVPLPAANEMGRVNAWIVDDDPLTLIDAGTRGPGALEALDRAFASAGRRVADVGLVVLTHQHTDHLGLVAEVVRRSGAEVAALAPVGPYLADFAGQAALDRAFMGELLRRHGATAREVAANEDGWARFHEAGESAVVTVPLGHGSRIVLRDRTLEVLHRPGHSETDVLLVDAERRTMFGGDHLLHAVPSVPVRDRPLSVDGGPAAYAPAEDDVAVTRRYRRSLAATAPLPVDVVLPGHGGPFPGPGGVVAGHLRRQERDAASLLRRAPDGAFTAMDLVRRTWPTAPGGLGHVLLSSVLGGLGLLLDDGRVAHAGDPTGADGPVRFVPGPPAA